MTATIDSSASEFLLPDPGEGLTEADIVSWRVAPGDTVEVNQILVEVETAKSLVELPSPTAGVVAALLVEEGQTVDVGSPIVRFAGAGSTADTATDTAAEAPAEEAGSGESGPSLVGYGASSASSKRRPRRKPAGPSAAPEQGTSTAGNTTVESTAGESTAAGRTSRPLAKPPVRKLAKDKGVDLTTVPATGCRGEVTREDVMRASEGGAAEASTGSDSLSDSGLHSAFELHGAPGLHSASGLHSAGPREERVPLGAVGKVMAKSMVDSAFTAPHVTEFLEVDMTRTMDFLRQIKATKMLGEDVRVSPLLLVARAALWAAGRNPRITATLDGDHVVVKNYVNLGIAAATPRGLVVPNVKDAHALGLADLAREIGELTATARAGRTSPQAMANGTFTITNVGVFGVDSGTPIINPGESAILAFGQVRKKPWVVDDEIVVREISQLSVSADHRVVDGEVISKFLADVGRALEEPLTLLV
ncbi:dihydrolipoamide acetyltransferase family protein [Brevibacterium litoralis]|uniref:dihydrolipoamide acetyltransferase family protein n=1 Tax=Brevibacterium litoralis TaxID=3138935 RepID=UPI0032EF038C